MIHCEGYLFILGFSLALGVPLGMGLRTLLALEERIIVPILRVQTESGIRQAITYKRMLTPLPSLRKPQQYLIVTPAKFTYPRRTS